MLVRIYLFDAKSATAGRWSDVLSGQVMGEPEEYVLAVRKEMSFVSSGPHVLGALWLMGQNDNGGITSATKHWRQRIDEDYTTPMRSMSVGDVVVLDDEWYMVDVTGWRHIGGLNVRTDIVDHWEKMTLIRSLPLTDALPRNLNNRGARLVAVPNALINKLLTIVGQDTDVSAYISGMVEARVTSLTIGAQ